MRIENIFGYQLEPSVDALKQTTSVSWEDLSGFKEALTNFACFKGRSLPSRTQPQCKDVPLA